MATRCNVLISEKGTFPFEQMMNWKENKDLLFYKHWDGYPSNMIPILKSICKDSGWDKETIAINLPDDCHEEYEISGDIDYLYMIDCDDEIIKYMTYGII